MKRIKPVVFSLCVIGLTIALVTKPKRGFSSRKIASNLSFCQEWVTDPLLPQEADRLSEIFSEPLTYLGSGAQCYAFVSSDGTYVLKFFKMRHLLPKTWLQPIPLPGLDRYKLKKIDRRLLRQKEVFNSYRMAFQYLRKETGLLFVHLNKTEDLDLQVTLVDKDKRIHTLNLNHYEFIIQKRSELVYDHLIRLMRQEDRLGFRKAICALIDQVIEQCKQGFVDRDSGIGHNYGFVGEEVIHFDVGRIAYDENVKKPAFYQLEALRAVEKIEKWLTEFYPDFLSDFEAATAPYKSNNDNL